MKIMIVDADGDKNFGNFEYGCIYRFAVSTESVHAFSDFCDLVPLQPECPCECLAPYLPWI